MAVDASFASAKTGLGKSGIKPPSLGTRPRNDGTPRRIGGSDPSARFGARIPPRTHCRQLHRRGTALPRVARRVAWHELPRRTRQRLSLIHISEPTRQAEISYAVFCLKKKKIMQNSHEKDKTDTIKKTI